MGVGDCQSTNGNRKWQSSRRPLSFGNARGFGVPSNECFQRVLPRNFSPAFADTPNQVAEFLSRGAAVLPGSEIIKQRNTAIDWLFYDVGVLTTDEFQSLSTEKNKDGTIIVVRPVTRELEVCVRKLNSYSELRADPGDLPQHLFMAGVGSSDVGAAALARKLANVGDASVGATVAGYGVADLLTEALGGWFSLGAYNRMIQAFHAHEARIKRTLAGLESTVGELDASTSAQAAASLMGITRIQIHC